VGCRRSACERRVDGHRLRYFGQQSGLGGIVVASAAGVFTPGGPMVSVPFIVVLMGWRASPSLSWLAGS
jgi:hypothetical protein